MPGFLRSDVHASLAFQTQQTLEFMQVDPVQMLRGKTGPDAPGWGERAFVYVFALTGFLLFWVVQQHSAKLQEARRKLAKSVAALQEVRVDDDNWMTTMPSTL